MNRAETNKKLAQGRADLLWEYYHANDKKITCKDVNRLTGQKAWAIYLSLRRHEVVGPPVWDSRESVRERNIENLWAKAKELDRNWLTIPEAAQALGKEIREIYLLKKRYAGYIPEIRNKRKTSSKAINVDGMKRQEVDSGDGLQYYQKRPGPQPGQVTYFLK